MKSKIKVAPSLLSADFKSLADELERINQLDIEVLHLDIMDGHFVPNISFGPLIVSPVRELTDLSLNVHLMITSPVKYAPRFKEAGADEIIFHKEITAEPKTVCQEIGKLTSVGIAFNPGTNDRDLRVLREIGEELSTVLLMTVHPGFGGQKFMEEVLPTIRTTRRIKEEEGFDFDIAVDGGIGPKTAPKAVKAGANLLVAGSSVFKYPNKNYSAAIKEILDFSL